MPREDALTVVVVARNAAATIARALRSVAGEAGVEVLLVDDGSSDDTVAVARACSGRIRLRRTPRHTTLAAARQFALGAVTTRFGAWLDADDEYLPGRVAALRSALEGGADIVADGAEIVDGLSGECLARAEIPEFVRSKRPPARLFERNYLPGDGVVGFRTGTICAIGYDPVGAADLDIILRGLASGAQVRLLDTVGYRIHAYPSSHSRDRARTRFLCRRALQKHPYERVRELLRSSGETPATSAWALFSMAALREEYDAAEGFLAEVTALDLGSELILEPAGPLPAPEGWRLAFCRGTLRLLQGDPQAARRSLEQAADAWASPETLNNLGVTLRRLGDPETAMRCFEDAVRLWPGYVDARLNRASREAGEITVLPLRRLASRTDYLAPPTSRTPPSAPPSPPSAPRSTDTPGNRRSCP